MKKLSVLFLCVFAVLSACKKEVENVEKLFTFEMRHEQAFVAKKDEINAVYNYVGPDLAYPLEIASDSEAEFKRNNTSTALVKNIKLQELKLAMPPSVSEDFSFLKDIEVYVAHKDGSEPLLMAYARNIPATVGKTLMLTPTENAMDKYVKSGNYSMKINGKMARMVTSDLDIKANMIFSVTASPLN